MNFCVFIRAKVSNYLSNQSKLWMSYYLSNNKKDFDKLIHEQIPMAEFNKSMLNRGTQVESYSKP